MTTKYKIIIIAAALVISFACGRLLTPVKTVTQTKTVEVEKQTEKSNTNTKEHTTTTIAKKPDGSTFWTIVDDKGSDTKSVDTTQVTDTSETTKTTTKESSHVTVSALAAMNVNALGTPVYGASITKSVLGPITAGVFGLQSGVVGVSLGLQF